MVLRSRSRLLGSLVLIAGASLLAACGGTGTSGSGSGSASGPIVVGGDGPYSGAASSTKGLIDGADSFFKQLGRDGGTIDGRKIKFETLDDRTAPDQAVANIRKLASDGAVGIIGPQTSTLVPPAGVVAVQNRIPLIAAGTPAELLASDYGYLGDISYIEEMSMEVKFLHDQLKLPAGSKLSFVGADTSAGVSTRDAFAAAAKAAGYQVVSNELIPSGAADVSAVVNGIRGAKPDGIGIALPDATFTLLMNGLNTAGLSNVPSVDYHAVSAGTLAAVKNPNAYALRQWELNTVDNPAMNKIRDAAEKDGYKAEFDTQYGFLSSYLEADIIYEALKKCGKDCTSQALAKDLSTTTLDIPGVTFGKVGFTPDRHIMVSSARVYHYDSASGQVVQASDTSYSGS